MTRTLRIARCLAAAATLAGAVSACGSMSSPHTAARAAALTSFQLPDAGAGATGRGNSWQQYGSRPVGHTLTLNPMTLDNSGSQPVVLLGVRQVAPAKGLVFGTPEVTLTPGFTGYSEYVSLGGPADAFNMHANFSPLRGFIVNPNPRRRMSGVSPTVVMTVHATRPGVFHIGDWIVSYRVGHRVHSVRLVDDGAFCAGANARSCPGM